MKKNRKWAALVLFAMLFCIMFGNAPFAEGTTEAEETALAGDCGDGVFWELVPEEDGYCLKIDGEGKIRHFAKPELAPWFPYRKQIHSLELGEGITAIGNRAFYECDFQGELSLPEELTYIGHYAFYRCRGLNGNLVIPSKVVWIGMAAFYDAGFNKITI